MIPAIETKPVQGRSPRPVYLKRAPADIWVRVNVNVIRSELRLTDNLVSLLAVVEPIHYGRDCIDRCRKDVADRRPRMTSPGANENG